jgi:putative SOS response-associated peptidase YedK
VQIFTILTTPPNEPNGAIHDRMRAILGRTGGRPMWLGEQGTTADQVLGILRRFLTGTMHA